MLLFDGVLVCDVIERYVESLRWCLVGGLWFEGYECWWILVLF